MSFYDYKVSQEISSKDYPFDALIMAAMRKADTENSLLLRRVWPAIWADLEARYWAAGGRIPTDHLHRGLDRRIEQASTYYTEDGDQRVGEERRR